MAEGKDNVKVAIRVRPLSDKEKHDMGGKTCISLEKDRNCVILEARPEGKTFTFDYVADSSVRQDEIFEKVGKPISSSCLSGYNGTIFAYGQTGAGKTFTILGPDTEANLEDFENSPRFQDRGLMPRCVEHIFAYINAAQDTVAAPEITYLVKASFLEIYQEQVMDLLNSSGQSANLQLREDLKRGVYVEGLIEEIVSSVADTYELMRIGTCNRHVGATSMNKESSRSHSVFTLTVESKEIRDGVTNFRSSRFHIIDLAGSERQRSTDAIGDRLREAGMINKSLSALGNVINSLVDIAEGKSRHVHYRDSKLTFLLKDSLGGNSKTFIVANISPSALSFGETLSTLKFAQRAKLIRNKAIVNEDTAGSVQLLKEEIRRLKEELSSLKEANLLGLGGLCPKCTNAEVTQSEGESDRLIQLESLIERNTRMRVRDTKALEDQLLAKDNSTKSLLVQVAKLEKKISNDKMVLKFRDSTIARLQSGQKGEESSELDNAKQEIQLLREQLESSANAAKLFIENEHLKEEIAALQREIMEEPESVYARYRENLDYTEQVMDWLNEDLESREKAKAVYADFQRYESGDLISEKVTSKHESALLDQKLEYVSRIQQLSDQISSLTVAAADAEAANRKKLEQQAKRIEELMSENVFLSKKCEEMHTLHVEVEDRKVQSEDTVKRMEEEVAFLTESLAACKLDLEARLSALTASEAASAALTSELQTVRDAFRATQLAHDSLSSDHQRLESEFAVLQSAYSALQQDLNDSEKALRSEQAAVQALKEAVDVKTSEWTAAVQELEVAQEDNRFIRTERDEWEAAVKDLKDERRELEAVNEELTAVIREQEEQANKAQEDGERDVDALRAQVKDSQDQAAQLVRDLGNARNALASAQKHVQTLESTLQSRTSSLAALQEAFDRASLQLQSFEAHSLLQDQRISSLEDTLQSVQSHAQQLSSQLLAESARAECALREKLALESDIQERVTLIAAQTDRESRLALDLKSLEADCLRAETELSAAHTRIHDLESQYAAEKMLWERDLHAAELALSTATDASAKDALSLSSLEHDKSALESALFALRTEQTALKAAFTEAEKAAKATIVESLEAEETLRVEMRDLRADLEVRTRENGQLSDALSAAMRDVEGLREELQEAHMREKELMHANAELSSRVEEWQGQGAAWQGERMRMETAAKERERLYEDKITSLAAHISTLQSSLEQYQDMLLAAEKRACAPIPDGQVSELQSALDSAQAEIKSLREDNKSKLEILQNTNRNILSTRQEIEMWKKCIEEKNEALHQLRHSLRRAEEEKVQLQSAQAKTKPCGHETELLYMKGVLERREKELFELKEKGQLYYAQADEAIETQRKEIDALTKRCAAYQAELAKSKDDLRSEERRRHRSHEAADPMDQSKENDRSPLSKGKALPPRKDETLLLKTQILRLREEVSTKTEQIEALQQLMRAKGRSREDEAGLREHYEAQIESLSAGLNRITEYVFSLPIVTFNPEETGIVESTIKAIASVYESYEAKCREQSRVRPQSEARGEAQPMFGANYVNPANYKNPVAHYHALLNSSSIKPGQLLSPGQQRKSPLKTKKP